MSLRGGANSRAATTDPPTILGGDFETDRGGWLVEPPPIPLVDA
jgi:hypothetical protein